MSAKNVRIMCPKLTCRKVLAVPENCRGKTVRCRNCGTNIRVPATAGANSQATQGPAKDSKAA